MKGFPVERRGIFYYRRRVPKNLVGVLGCWCIVRSLRTKSSYLAFIRYGFLGLFIERLFEFIVMSNLPDPQALRDIFFELLREGLGLSTSKNGLGLPVPHDPNETMGDLEEWMKNEEDELYYEGRNVIERVAGLKVYQNKFSRTDIQQIGLLYFRARREHLHQMEMLRKTGYFGQVYDNYFEDVFAKQKTTTSHTAPALYGLDKSEGSIKDPNISLSQSYGLAHVFEAFKKEEGHLWDRKRAYKFENAFATVSSLLGPDFPINDVDQEQMRLVKDMIIQLPVNANKKGALKGKSILEQIQIADKFKFGRISSVTVNDRLKNISVWFEWAKNNKYVDENIFKGVRVKNKKAQVIQRIPFQAADLETIFKSPVYKGMKSHSSWRLPGSLIERNMRYWVPLIAAHTGMRLEEICQLKRRHICQQKDIWFFNLKDDPELRIKSQAGRRLIPLHSSLLEDWGFKSWYQQNPHNLSQDDQLFKDAIPDVDGRYSDKFSKWFGHFLEATGVKKDGLVFHSFRHMMADLCRNSGMEFKMMQCLMGHSSGSVSDVYGQGYKLETLNAAIQKIEIPFAAPKSKVKNMR